MLSLSNFRIRVRDVFEGAQSKSDHLAFKYETSDLENCPDNKLLQSSASI